MFRTVLLRVPTIIVVFIKLFLVLDDVQTARQDSLAALSDLISNHTQYTTNQAAEVLVNVIRQAVDVLSPTYQDIRALVSPTTTLNATISSK